MQRGGNKKQKPNLSFFLLEEQIGLPVSLWVCKTPVFFKL